MDPATKQQLNELINRPGLNNRVCADCGGQNPQWCSLSFANFICLTCAGIHRGFGVHISFVRSVAMDSFSDEQLRRMKLGGNAPLQEFLTSYEPADIGGYSSNLSIHDKYHCWAASQYREKLTAALEDKPWSPSLPPADFSEVPSRPDSSQSTTRKSRVGGRASNLGRQGSNSPFQSEGSPLGTPQDQRSRNQTYFESLGAANAARPDDLPPSQGGRYAGFGSTPSPAAHPSFGTSSQSAPSLAELQSDPMAALGKGWSIFSTAVVGATRTLNENVIQPGIERVTDPEFQKGVTDSVSKAGQNANSWGKNAFGVDVGQVVGGWTKNLNVGGGAGAARGQYSQVGSHGNGYGDFDDEQGSALYGDGGDDDFFKDWDEQKKSFGNSSAFGSSSTSKPDGNTSSQTAITPTPAVPPKKKDEFEDEWKDF